MSKLPPVLQDPPLPVIASPLRLQSHLHDLLCITAASWGLAPPMAGPLLPHAQPAPPRALAPAHHPPPCLRA
jgi:hypothetical protein